MRKYTIYTENKNLDKIKAILNDCITIKGFTIIKTKGYWQGVKEEALKIEILASKDLNYQVKIICKKIKIVNRQEAVLLTIEKIETCFI